MKIPHKLFLLGPLFSFCTGFLMNVGVMACNKNMMPVLMPGGCSAGHFEDDPIHSCMTAATHLKILADWANVQGLGVASPGDLFLWVGYETIIPAFLIWCALMIYDHNMSYEDGYQATDKY